MEQRISSEWAAEQALREEELASLPSAAEDPAPLRGPRTRVTPDDVVAAARDGMRTARAHRVVSRELPEPPPETSRTLPESPRNWEERAAELEELLVEQQLASARARADIEAKLLATERQLALSARAAGTSPQLSQREVADGCASPSPHPPLLTCWQCGVSWRWSDEAGCAGCRTQVHWTQRVYLSSGVYGQWVLGYASARVYSSIRGLYKRGVVGVEDDPPAGGLRARHKTWALRLRSCRPRPWRLRRSRRWCMSAWSRSSCMLVA